MKTKDLNRLANLHCYINEIKNDIVDFILTNYGKHVISFPFNRHEDEITVEDITFCCTQSGLSLYLRDAYMIMPPIPYSDIVDKSYENFIVRSFNLENVYELKQHASYNYRKPKLDTFKNYMKLFRDTQNMFVKVEEQMNKIKGGVMIYQWLSVYDLAPAGIITLFDVYNDKEKKMVRKWITIPNVVIGKNKTAEFLMERL